MKSIVYVPGLGHGLSGRESLENYANRYLNAIELSDSKPSGKYKITYSKMSYGKKDVYNADVATITKINGDGEEQKYKLYMLDYADLLVKNSSGKNPFMKLLFTVYFMILNIPSFTKLVLNNKQKHSLTTRIQYLYMAIIFVVVCLGGVFVLPSLIVLLQSILTDIQQLLVKQNWFTYWSAGKNLQNDNSWLDAISNILLFLTGIISLFIPKFQQFVIGYSDRIVGFGNYLRLGDEKLNIIGKFELLIDSIIEHENIEKVEVHGYSLGSIIVIDAFFPVGNKPACGLQSRVDTIVTIGSLYEFISKMYPAYFAGRRMYDLKVLHWFNIYSTIDVIASNFNTDRKMLHASYGIAEGGILPENILFEAINPDQLTYLDYLMLVGLKAHTMYWGSEADSVNCLRDLVLTQQKKFSDELRMSLA